MKAHRRRIGFTLVELLVVMAIMLIIISLIVPAFNSISRGSNLTHSGQLVTDQLTLARQNALSHNRLVEVRIYKVPGEAGGAPVYRALQVLELDERGENPKAAGSLIRLAQSVIISPEASFSSLIDKLPPQSAVLPQIDPASPATPYNYVQFRFKPNGAPDFDPTLEPWFLTIHYETDASSGSTPPKNYVCLKIDVTNGRLQAFRP